MSREFEVSSTSSASHSNSSSLPTGCSTKMIVSSEPSRREFSRNPRALVDAGLIDLAGWSRSYHRQSGNGTATEAGSETHNAPYRQEPQRAGNLTGRCPPMASSASYPCRGKALACSGLESGRPARFGVASCKPSRRNVSCFCSASRNVRSRSQEARRCTTLAYDAHCTVCRHASKSRLAGP